MTDKTRDIPELGKGGPAVTREEAISRIQDHMERHEIGKYPHIRLKEAFELALSALRPVSREQVEKVWRGEWIVQQGEHSGFIKKCPKCGFPISGWWGADKFCANCGEAFTDEAMQMVMERLEEIYK